MSCKTIKLLISNRKARNVNHIKLKMLNCLNYNVPSDILLLCFSMI